jgi:hypothetical protein
MARRRQIRCSNLLIKQANKQHTQLQIY